MPRGCQSGGGITLDIQSNDAGIRMSIRVIGFNNNLDHKLTETHIYGRLRLKDITGVIKDMFCAPRLRPQESSDLEDESRIRQH